MTRRGVGWAVAAVVAFVALFGSCVLGVPIMLALSKAAEASVCGTLTPQTSDGAPQGGDAWMKWDARQVGNAAVIVAVGKQKKVPAWGYVIALATAMQESGIRNEANDNPQYPRVVALSLALPHDGVGHDNDSVGIFQQRPIEGAGGWGTVQELMTPSTSASKFYNALLQVPGWQQMRLTDAAQAVQHSGTPEAYQKWEQDAKDLAAHVLGLPNIDVIGGGGPAAPCGAGQFGPVPVGPNGWVQPLDKPYSIGAPFGQDRGDHIHAGVDLVADNIRGKPIRAVAEGTVTVVACQSGSGTCDHDGGLGVGGCGWYVEIRHPGNVVTRYCHQLQKPFVTVGQTVSAGTVIGLVGASGNASGPHLHFEVHVKVPAGGPVDFSNAVDPVPFMAAQKAPLT